MDRERLGDLRCVGGDLITQPSREECHADPARGEGVDGIQGPPGMTASWVELAFARGLLETDVTGERHDRARVESARRRF